MPLTIFIAFSLQVSCFFILHGFTQFQRITKICHMNNFFTMLGVVCGSSIILQAVNAPLWSIFTLLNVAHFYKYLNLVLFLHYNCLGMKMLKNILYLPVIFLCLYLQLGYLLLAHHAFQYLHPHQSKVIWKICTSHSL